MALATASSPSRRSRVVAGPADLCALACAASAGVHGALVAPHAGQSTRLAVAFLLTTAALVVAALALALHPTRGASAAAAALLMAVATAYLLSRTSGIPGLAEHPEPLDTLGATTSLLEVVAAIVALRHTHPRRH